MSPPPPTAAQHETEELVVLRTNPEDHSSPMPRPPQFADKLEERQYLKERLAAAFRIFAKHGFDEGVGMSSRDQFCPPYTFPIRANSFTAGHITVRDPIETDTFWVNPFGTHFSLITASQLLHVDHSGRILSDSGPLRNLNAAAFAIHSAIHAARPDVLCAAHAHSLYGRAFCALHKELDMITQDSCAFYQDHVVFKEFNGVVLQSEEGARIAKTLGSRKAALLGNHGILTIGRSIESCIFWFLSMEKCCKTQLLADAAGETVKIGEQEAKLTHKTVGSEVAGWFSGRPLFDVVDKETAGDYKL
jgi:ribulose-5-phosphate 4-epimerase/fuculose-1-phosphate aldolase